MQLCVDCRVDNNLENDFLTLNLWGKPLFTYVVEEMLKTKGMGRLVILTDSIYIESLCAEYFDNRVDVRENLPEQFPVCVVSGRAAFLKAVTVESAVGKYCGGYLCSAKEVNTVVPKEYIDNASFLCGKNEIEINAFVITDGNDLTQNIYILNPTEAIVINNVNDFELALVIKKKELNVPILTQAILGRIEEKKDILAAVAETNGICMVGHSQIDNWEIDEISGRPVRNCGIRGISSFEYNKYILEPETLFCNEDTYILMHGTNDIVYDYSFEEITASILKSISYIYARRPEAVIYFVQCIHVNGRLDRSNRCINELNSYLEKHLTDVKWIKTDKMNDEFDNLKAEYTIDGLHLNDEGYCVLRQIIEDEVAK